MRIPPRRRHRRLPALAALALATLAGANVASAAPESDAVLVQIDSGTTRSERSVIADRLDADGVVSLPGGWREYHVPVAVSAAQARSALAGADGVAEVRLPQRLEVLDTPDPYLASGQQWALRNTGSGGGTAGVDIDADGGWPLLAARQPVTVAVLDTGVQTAHPDLAGQVWTNPGEIAGNGVDDDRNGFVDDVQGWDFANGDASVYDDATADRHGTHVAGVIAARSGDGVGMAGIAPGARVMSVKFIGAGGSGWNSDAVRGIQYAVANGAKVINASFGGSGEDPVLCDAIAWAAQRGVLFVAAAGNDGADIGTSGTWPARCAEPSMLTVAAVTNTGGLASFSNRSAVHVDLGAPGQSVLSTVPGGYALMSGTSMATPQVTGVAAAVLGESPGLTPAQVRSAILDGGRPLPALAGTTVSGRIVDLRGAVQAAAGIPPDLDAPAPFELLAPADGGAVAQSRPVFTWQPASDAGGAVTYRLRLDGAVAAVTPATSAGPAADLPDGVHLWSVEAVDGAGNVRATPARAVLVDRGAPSAPVITSPGRGARLAPGTVSVRWTPATDAGSGVAGQEVLVDGHVVARPAAGATGASVTLAAGAHALVVRASDAAGNTRASAPVGITAAAPAPLRRVVPRVVVTRPVRVGARTVVRVRATRPARVTLVVGTAKGRRVGTIRAVLPRGTTRLVLPARVADAAGSAPRVAVASVGLAL